MPFRLPLPHPLRPRALVRAATHHRRITTTAPQRIAIPPAAPSPPRLSPAEQAEFERLQRQSSGAFSTSQHYAAEKAGEEEGLVHPDVRRGAAPEFEGEVNPKTGEVGGPKNDPLRHGDYSFNGRVTDF